MSRDSAASIRPLDRAEIDRRLRSTVGALVASRAGLAVSRPVPIAAADLVRLAAPLTSRN